MLEPGADEKRNLALMGLGGLLMASFGLLTLRTNNFFNRMIAWRKANPPKMPARPKEKVGSLPHGFVSFEPGCKRKLNCFECRDELDQFLGDEDDKALQAWKPDDRIIDVKGQEYRLVPNTNKTRYDMEPTSEIWTWEKLLDVAVADARLLKKDTDALRRCVTDAPVEERIPVLMKCIEDQSSGPRWAIAALILFLVAFFFAVFFGVPLLFALLGKLVQLLHQK